MNTSSAKQTLGKRYARLGMENFEEKTNTDIIEEVKKRVATFNNEEYSITQRFAANKRLISVNADMEASGNNSRKIINMSISFSEDEVYFVNKKTESGSITEYSLKLTKCIHFYKFVLTKKVYPSIYAYGDSRVCDTICIFRGIMQFMWSRVDRECILHFRASGEKVNDFARMFVRNPYIPCEALADDMKISESQFDSINPIEALHNIIQDNWKILLKNSYENPFNALPNDNLNINSVPDMFFKSVKNMK